VARSRNIKPGFFSNDKLAELEPLARILFAGLWCHSDREGRLEDRPRKIKADILPYDNCDCTVLLQCLHDAGFILRYAANGTGYIQCVNFLKHQNPHIKEVPSTIPAPGKHSSRTVLIPEIPELARLIPDSLNLIPSSLIPDSLQTQPPSACACAPPTPPGNGVARKGNGKSKAPTADPPVSAETWQAYSTAYLNRWNTEPVRNARVNSDIKHFVERIGATEAPGVAAFYLTSNRGLYVSSKHCTNLLLRDAEGLRTEWATGTQVMETEAHQADKRQATGNVFTKLISEAK